MKNKLLATLFGAALVLGACGGNDDNASEPADDATNDNGAATSDIDAEAVVQQHCISCHGSNLEGGAGPALENIGSEISEEEIHDTIINGKGAMPPKIIEGDEADAVAAWLAEKK